MYLITGKRNLSVAAALFCLCGTMAATQDIDFPGREDIPARTWRDLETFARNWETGLDVASVPYRGLQKGAVVLGGGLAALFGTPVGGVAVGAGLTAVGESGLSIADQMEWLADRHGDAADYFDQEADRASAREATKPADLGKPSDDAEEDDTEEPATTPERPPNRCTNLVNLDTVVNNNRARISWMERCRYSIETLHGLHKHRDTLEYQVSTGRMSRDLFYMMYRQTAGNISFWHGQIREYCGIRVCR